MSEYTDADAPPAEGGHVEEQWDKIAEQSVLGGMMLSPLAVDEVMQLLRPSDFYAPKHELIALAIGSLRSRNNPTDPVAVTEELRRTERLTKAGGAAYLHELTSIVPTASNAGFYARALRDLSVKRQLVQVGMTIKSMGYASEGDVEDLVKRARHDLDAITVGRASKVRPIGDTLFDLIGTLDEKPRYYSSPWESLDKLIGGFAPGGLYIFGARPGSGKTICALQAAAHLAHKGVVAFSSLEMAEAELQLRLIAQYGPVHQTFLRNRTLTADDKKRVFEAWQAIKGAPIYIDDTAGVSMSQVRTHARTVSRHGKLVGVVVDYLQLVRGGLGDTQQERIADVAHELKALAKDLDVPVIAAAQLKRAGDRSRGRKLPDLDDLRESGAIEQDADCVILLDRDKEKSPRDLTVVVAKNRHGETGRFSLHWQAEFARVNDKKWTPSGLFEEAEVH